MNGWLQMEFIPAVSGQEGDTPWTNSQLIAGLTFRNKQPYTLSFTPKFNLESLFFFNCGSMKTLSELNNKKQRQFLLSALCLHANATAPTVGGEKKKRVNESLPSSFSPPGREASAAAPPSCFWGQRHPQVPWQQVPPWEHYANHEGEFACVAEAYKAFIKNEFSSSQTCSLSQSQAALLTDGLHLSASVTLPDTVGYKWTNVCLQQNLIFMWFRNMKTEKVLNCSAKRRRRKEDSEHYSLNTPTLQRAKYSSKT